MARADATILSCVRFFARGNREPTAGSTSFEPVTAPTSTPDRRAFEHHWQDEADAAFLYRFLAAEEPDNRKKSLYLNLAEVEDKHGEVWARLLSEHGRNVGPHRPSARTRLLATLGRW